MLGATLAQSLGRHSRSLGPLTKRLGKRLSLILLPDTLGVFGDVIARARPRLGPCWGGTRVFGRHSQSSGATTNLWEAAYSQS
ncbi:hypothetical protein Nepgr_034004 [Nepenthes gracilis]|uniref:Uncharacterized protein n=1 Tax=Nepenthes gracilis TaxID=150966 RepID=A0AAD3Y8S6_NEPGR|nr:hypothetical protein Nepgr_034004 [Nepenthes gracilis]